MVGYFVNTFIVETLCKYLYKVYICNFTGLFIAQTELTRTGSECYWPNRYTQQTEHNKMELSTKI